MLRATVCFQKANMDACLRVSPELKSKQHDTKLESQSRVAAVLSQNASAEHMSLCLM